MRSSGITRVVVLCAALFLLVSCSKGSRHAKAVKSKIAAPATASTGTGNNEISSVRKSDAPVPPYNNGVTQPGNR